MRRLRCSISFSDGAGFDEVQQESCGYDRGSRSAVWQPASIPLTMHGKGRAKWRLTHRAKCKCSGQDCGQDTMLEGVVARKGLTVLDLADSVRLTASARLQERDHTTCRTTPSHCQRRTQSQPRPSRTISACDSSSCCSAVHAFP